MMRFTTLIGRRGRGGRAGAPRSSARASTVCDVAMVMPTTMWDSGTPAGWLEGTTGNDIIIDTDGVDHIDGRGGEDLIAEGADTVYS